MDIEARIAAKKQERIAKGFALRITYEGRPAFDGYYVDKATFDENYAIAIASIGKFDRRHNCTALSVEVL